MISVLINLIPGWEIKKCINKIKEELIDGEFIVLDKDLTRKYCFDKKINNAINELAIELDKKLNVDLSWARDLVDTSMLGSVHTLNVSGIHGITNVDNLGSVHTLDLTGCHNIKNVNNLGKVHKLTITNCDITDVSMLEGVYELKMNNCDKVTDTSMLGNVHKLTLGGIHNDNVSLKNLGSVNQMAMHLNKNITSLEPLAFGTIMKIVLFRCSGIVDISPLCDVEYVSLECCDNIVDVNVLKNVKKLILVDCKKIKDISLIYKVEMLALINSEHIFDVGNLRGLDKLMVMSKKPQNKKSKKPRYNKVYGLYLLLYLKKLVLSTEIKLEMTGEIRKLKKINEKLNIEITDME